MVIVIMGVSGSGKTTIGQKLAEALGWEFFEGDDFHPGTNVEKMRQGIPLSHFDRLPWLKALSDLIGRLSRNSQSAVLTCSALREEYRRIISRQAGGLKFVYLKGSYELIKKRLEKRIGHFMEPGLLKSQFAILEEPENTLVIDISLTPEEIVKQVIQSFDL